MCSGGQHKQQSLLASSSSHHSTQAAVTSRHKQQSPLAKPNCSRVIAITGLVLLIAALADAMPPEATRHHVASLDVGEGLQLFDSACTDDEKAAGKTDKVVNGTASICVACEYSTDKQFTDVGSCVEACPDDKPSNQEKVCTCPDGFAVLSDTDSSCVACAESSGLQYRNGGVCVEACPDAKPANDASECTCPDGKAEKDATNSTCVACIESAGFQFTYANGCIDACPNSMVSDGEDTKVCVCVSGETVKGGDDGATKDRCVKCKDSAELQFDDVGACMATCPQGKISNNDDQRCECPLGSAVKNETVSRCVSCADSADFQFTNVGECVNACPGHKPEDGNKACRCPDSKPFYLPIKHFWTAPFNEGSSCVESCPIGTQSNNDDEKECIAEDLLVLSSLLA